MRIAVKPISDMDLVPISLVVQFHALLEPSLQQHLQPFPTSIVTYGLWVAVADLWEG